MFLCLSDSQLMRGCVSQYLAEKTDEHGSGRVSKKFMIKNFFDTEILTYQKWFNRDDFSYGNIGILINK